MKTALALSLLIAAASMPQENMKILLASDVLQLAQAG